MINLAKGAVLALALLAAVPAAAEFDADRPICVIAREEGSGTRGAFVELTGVEQTVGGQKADMTTVDAQITNSTAVMTMSVADDAQAIGYVSLGSLQDTVKAVRIEGVAPTAQTVADGSYPIARPFNIAWREEAKSALAADFLAFLVSAEGQAVVRDNGYVGVDGAQPYAGSPVAGKLVVGGSSSVSPVMEKLIEAYAAFNPNADIELQTTDSTTGMTNAMQGAYDIGMASRALKDGEAAALASLVLATDGIAVIVNPENPVQDMRLETVGKIYLGEITRWNEL